jgi:hypothetical protein
MTPEFIERAKKDFDKDDRYLDWESFLAGYWAATKRFGGRNDMGRNRTRINSSKSHPSIPA